MKELARKGNIVIETAMIGEQWYWIKNNVGGFTVDIEELTDLKDCISQVTAKKIEVEKDTNGVLYFRCPDCSTYVDRDDGYCSRCGLKLEGVDE